MKDSFAYRCAVFWNTISLNEPGFSHTNQNELYTIDWKQKLISTLFQLQLSGIEMMTLFIFDRFIDMILDVLFYYSYLFIL